MVSFEEVLVDATAEGGAEHRHQGTEGDHRGDHADQRRSPPPGESDGEDDGESLDELHDRGQERGQRGYQQLHHYDAPFLARRQPQRSPTLGAEGGVAAARREQLGGGGRGREVAVCFGDGERIVLDLT